MQDIDSSMIARRGSEWLSSAARLQLQNEQRNAKYGAMMQDRIKELAEAAEAAIRALNYYLLS
ncbi:MAG TPA: hypothetical protein VFM46_09750 [Pseudomonadales bacterium]|nr:hypothetical protein [Pseudomonadales bacterium]